jgi:hypothetical protein
MLFHFVALLLNAHRCTLRYRQEWRLTGRHFECCESRDDSFSHKFDVFRIGIILDFDAAPEVLGADSLYDYTGWKDFASACSLEATLDTCDSSLYVSGRSVSQPGEQLDYSFAARYRLHPHVASLPADCDQRDRLTGRDLDNLKELHLVFNTIRDVSHLLGMHRLRILDLEGNQISDVTSVELFGCSAGLRSLTLSGNPVALAIHFLRHAM